MTTRTILVEAATVLDARSQAVAEARRDLFDPVRVVQSRIQGFVRFGPSGAIFRYAVDVDGHVLSESEARYLWGDR